MKIWPHLVYVLLFSSKKGDGETEWETRERAARRVYVPGRSSLTVSDTAQLIYDEARGVLADDMSKLGVNLPDNLLDKPRDNRSNKSRDNPSTRSIRKGSSSYSGGDGESDVSVVSAAVSILFLCLLALLCVDL